MAVLHRAYTFDAKEFVNSLKATVISHDKVLLGRFRQLAIEAAATPSPDIQEALTWMRFDADEWLSEGEDGAGQYFLVLLASKLSSAPSLSSRETIEGYYQGLHYALQKARWKTDEIQTLIRGNSLKEMLRFYSKGIADTLLEQPFFADTIHQSGAGWLSPNEARRYYEQLKLAHKHFNEFPSMRQVYDKLRYGLPLNSFSQEQAYEHTIMMLESSINSNNDLLLILD